MEVTLHALSSDGKTRYPVTFLYVDELLTARCECAAGQYGKYCKHVAKFLAGDSSLLADNTELPFLNSVAGWAHATNLDERSLELNKLQERIEKDKKTLKDMKAQLWKELYQGFSG